MTRDIPDEALALFVDAEDFRADAYRDSGGVLTIGWGHTRGVREGDHVTYHQAVALLRVDLDEVASAVGRLVKVPLTDGQFGALCSFVFNVGAHALATSTLLEFLNVGAYNAIPDQLCRWIHDRAGNPQPGLVLRRRCEADMWSA